MRVKYMVWLGLGGLMVAPVCAGEVELLRTPQDGLQPQAVVDAQGVLHVIYFQGEPAGGDLFYTRRLPEASTWSAPLRVNRRPATAVAVGTIRGGQLALGKNGRLHVVWNGRQKAASDNPRQAPLFYTRMNRAGDGFEPERNVITYAFGLDGGSSVAADPQGNVYVVWHAPLPGRKGEAGRAVFVARSTDEGKTFAREEAVNPPASGVCPCCGLKALADHAGRVFILYRTARELSHRDMTLLVSTDGGQPFQAIYAHPWTVFTCPMSSASLAESRAGLVAAWETQQQVYWSWIQPGETKVADPVAPSGSGNRKHPSVAVNTQGEVLLAWTEGTGWAKGGFLEWQVFDRDGHPISQKHRVAGLAAWSMPAAVARPNGNFVIVY